MKPANILVSLLLCASAVSPTSVLAQAYPSRPVHVVVPYPPGGSSDVIARILNAKLGEALKQSFIVDNRAGAATLLGTTYVAKAQADGYTLLLADVPFTVNPAVLPAAQYNPLKDFTPIAIVGTSVQALYANPSKIKSLADLLARAKAKPGEVSISTTGNGSTSDLMTELFQGAANVKLLKVPYKGSAPALSDAAAGHVDGSFSSLASAAPLVNAGKLKVIAVAAQQRLPAFPDTPTFIEAGIPIASVRHWWGILGPAGLPQDVVQRLQVEIAKAIALQDVREQLRTLSVDTKAASTENFQQLLEEDVQRWTRVVKDNNIKAD
jgi:tripartite-type tricarboxylate transporter receptor subunit TctC